jgi:hypothetical protein
LRPQAAIDGTNANATAREHEHRERDRENDQRARCREWLDGIRRAHLVDPHRAAFSRG